MPRALLKRLECCCMLFRGVTRAEDNCQHPQTQQSLTSVAVYLQVSLKVGMSCQGCVGSVNRVLNKLEGERLPVLLPVRLQADWCCWSDCACSRHSLHASLLQRADACPAFLMLHCKRDQEDVSSNQQMHRFHAHTRDAMRRR